MSYFAFHSNPNLQTHLQAQTKSTNEPINVLYSFVEAQDESQDEQKKCRYQNVHCTDNDGNPCNDESGNPPTSKAACTGLSNLLKTCSFSFTCSNWDADGCEVANFTLCGMLSTLNRRCLWQRGRCESVCPSMSEKECKAFNKPSYASNCKGASCEYNMEEKECVAKGCEFYPANSSCIWQEVSVNFLFCQVSCPGDTMYTSFLCQSKHNSEPK